jgi:hypothetical protein
MGALVGMRSIASRPARPSSSLNKKLAMYCLIGYTCDTYPSG